ncbi:hypothetical protein AB0952_31505 [Streptomyces caniferus]
MAQRCTADFVLPRYHVAVFVDGRFWHGCPDHTPWAGRCSLAGDDPDEQ